MMPTMKKRRAARRNLKNAAVDSRPRKNARRPPRENHRAVDKLADKITRRVNQVLFVQGGGRDSHDSWDKRLVASLKKELGSGYTIRYPRMPGEADPDPTAWKKAIDRELRKVSDGVMLVGHSIGAAILVDYLADGDLERRPSGVFLIATPFIGDGGWPSDDLRPTKELAGLLPDGAPLYLYHGRDSSSVEGHQRSWRIVPGDCDKVRVAVSS